jgi:hypothetical protein
VTAPIIEGRSDFVNNAYRCLSIDDAAVQC